MRPRITAPLLCVLLAMALLTASRSQAGCSFCFFENVDLRVEPSTPRGGGSFRLMANNSPCFFFTVGSNSASHYVEREDSILRVYVYIAGGAICLHDVTTASWVLGPYPAGDYTVELYGVDSHSNIAYPMDTLGLQIAAAAPVPQPAVIPATGALTNASLIALLGLLGFVVWRRARD